MRILRIKAEGLPLYKDTFDISFFAAQRVQSDHLNSVYNLFGNIYINVAEAFIGINASGKTTALKIVSFVNLLLKAAPLNSDFIPQIFEENKPVVFDVDFFADNKVFHLKSEIVNLKNTDGMNTIRILSEKLWIKRVTSRINKTNLMDFTGLEPIRVRDNSDEYLPDDVSIMIAVNKQIPNNDIFVDLALFTNFNLLLPDSVSVSSEIITLLDPTIEYIKVENINNKEVTRLKFYEREELVLLNATELNAYLSSGTVKGVRVFSDAIRVLKNGGYLIVDEIENHFNRELVVSLLRLFMNRKTNPKGAIIIFSTHYPELLNELVRNDAVFITRNDNSLTIDNLNLLINRNDIKKSEVYQSNYLGGTAPKYKSLLDLQRSIVVSLEE